MKAQSFRVVIWVAPSSPDQSKENVIKKELAAILVIGDCRDRSQQALDSIYAQMISDTMEIIVVDLACGSPRLVTSPRIQTTYLAPQEKISWAQARARAVRAASAPVVAFIEDHCIAARGWAQALIEAHHGPWACVGYAFTNPMPQRYLARAVLMAEYGMWQHPAEAGRVRIIPCGNISYKRDLLLALGNELEFFLTPDFAAFQRLAEQGGEFYIEPRAQVAHYSLATFPDFVFSSIVFCRLLGARRAQTQEWNWSKRFFYGLATPLVAPVISIGRLVASLRHRRSLWGTFIEVLPVVCVKQISSALGETIGYLFGSGSAEADLSHIELNVARIQAR